ncbi:MAG: hypothetical protein CVU89_13155 [Firmicutes bacterium HGW-Firmicutes-14]|nr:MAG: hypothetical protein CVU89_13155 [Firmicutes bacterium HGW-Firmicutes-14]
MDNFGIGRWGLKVLSLLLAVVLWVYVSNEINPTKQREFKAIPVETRGIGQNLAVSELPASVNIRVQANQSIIAELDVRSIDVFVDLSRAKPGKSKVPVQFRVPQGVKVTDLRPQEVSVTIEAVAEKQVPVEVHFTGEPAEGYTMLGVRTKPDEIIIRGPKSIIDTVDFASVEIGLQDRNKSFGEIVPVKVSNSSGEFMEERIVMRTPSTIDFLVTIVPDMPTKKIRVVPHVTGQPDRGYTVTGTLAEPGDLVITGEPDVIQGITEVYTQPVDITGAKEDIYVETEPVLPQGVMADRQYLRVLVKIAPK